MRIDPRTRGAIESSKMSRFEHISRSHAISVFAALLTSSVISLVLLSEYGLGSASYSPLSVLLVGLNGLILIYLSTLYFLASKLYSDIFYFLVSTAWLGFVIKVLLQLFAFSPQRATTPYLIGIGLLDFVPTTLLYVASFSRLNSRSPQWKIVLKIAGWMLQRVITIALGYLLISGEPRIALIFAIAECPFSAWALIRVGKAIEQRTNASVPPKWVNLLSRSFYFYGSLQCLYAATYLDTSRSASIFVLGFGLALVLKVVNGVALIAVMLVEFDGLQEQLIQRSVLEDIGALTASIEHDIRSPLGVINAEMEGMKRRFQFDREMLARISRVEELTHRIFAATQIVTMLRGDADFYQGSMERVSVGDVVRRAVKAVKREAETSNIHFKFYEAKVMFTKANISMLEQIVVNILKNSVEAIRETGRQRGTIKVEVKRAQYSDQPILIDITDNGCGINEEDIPKLTTIFTTKTKRKPNSGIGLFVSDRIVKLHNGRLEIKSKIGEGTSVSVFLPLWRS